MDVKDELINLYDEKEDIRFLDLKAIASFHRLAKDIVFLDYLCPDCKNEELPNLLEDLKKQLEYLFSLHPETNCNASCFIESLPKIRKLSYGSAIAIYEGDPAAKSLQEVILCYPGFEAILSYRIAHELLEIGLPMEARLISEEAHARTGIDIHPGAKIGSDFFIDHGTGIVIGETTIIGDHVKLYQGVTLGALSLEKGQQLKGIKRHPSIEDYVTIYSNAAIFGGETVIGHHSTIGASVSLRESVPAFTMARIGKNGLTLSSKIEK